MLPAFQIPVQEVYTHMVQHNKVITISGRPGIGKTEVGWVNRARYVDLVFPCRLYRFRSFETAHRLFPVA